MFVVNRPANCLERSQRIETELDRIELRALYPVGLIMTKVARCDLRDRDDIRRTQEKLAVRVAEVEGRVLEIVYVGSEAAYDSNLQTAIRECFGAT